MSKKIFIIAGARPNFMKIAPFIYELNKQNLEYKLIHTGQHYDYLMSKVFFDELGIPEPDIHLSVGSASHAVQTAKIMIKFEKVLLNEKPTLIVVVGDVNSTLACSLVAKKLHIKIAHIEAGLRSFDQNMPEEINRILTDQLSDFLFTTEKDATINLKREGINSNKIFFVGNIMIDNLIKNLEKAKNLKSFNKYHIKKKEYGLITIHRPSNVDNKEQLEKIFNIIDYIRTRIKIFFPIHPRTKATVKKFNLMNKMKKENLILSEPIGYLEFLNLMKNAKLILTDSGGIQEEASYLKIPTLTLRKNTERPITIEKGTNTIVDIDFEKAKTNINKILSNTYKKGHDIEKWDGNTSQRIVTILKERLFKN
ncbi:MAG: non-hydrolyzing UDP-N-acetylglucosamine 2-epimerase [Promethearchaeota archaeon]